MAFTFPPSSLMSRTEIDPGGVSLVTSMIWRTLAIKSSDRKNNAEYNGIYVWLRFTMDFPVETLLSALVGHYMK